MAKRNEPCTNCGSPDGAGAQCLRLDRGNSVVPTFVRTWHCWVCGAERDPVIVKRERYRLAS
jgi:hypothetical protein